MSFKFDLHTCTKEQKKDNVLIGKHYDTSGKNLNTFNHSRMNRMEIFLKTRTNLIILTLYMF